MGSFGIKLFFLVYISVQIILHNHCIARLVPHFHVYINITHYMIVVP